MNAHECAICAAYGVESDGIYEIPYRSIRDGLEPRAVYACAACVEEGAELAASAYPIRRPAHVEPIGGGRAGLFLGTPGPDAEGPEGYALVDAEGRVQWLAEDCRAGTFRHLDRDRTTGAYVLPDDVG